MAVARWEFDCAMVRFRAVSLSVLMVIAVVHQTLMGGTFVFARIALQQVDPFTVAFIRFTVAGSILLAVSRWRTRQSRATPIPASDRKRIWILGVGIIFGNQLLYLYGQAFTTAAHGALLFTLTPVFAYVISESAPVVKAYFLVLAVSGPGSPTGRSSGGSGVISSPSPWHDFVPEAGRIHCTNLEGS